MTHDRSIAEKHWRISEELTKLNTGGGCDASAVVVLE
jgi:hypothetical protein